MRYSELKVGVLNYLYRQFVKYIMQMHNELLADNQPLQLCMAICSLILVYDDILTESITINIIVIYRNLLTLFLISLIHCFDMQF